MIVHQFPDRTITINQEKYLYFGGTSYLGLATNKKFLKIISKNIKKWGSSYGSSRSANIQVAAYESGEKTLANYIKSEAAVTVSSGMLAGKIVIELLQQETAMFYHFPNSHHAIKAPNSLPFFVDGLMNPRLLDSTEEKIVLLSDSIPTSSVVPINLSYIEKIPTTKTITLVLDESHSLGIVGKNGCGLFSSIACANIQRKIMISSLGKALGLTGGVIASDNEFIVNVKNLGSFVSAAGMAPAYVQSLRDGIGLVHKQHDKLMKNLTFLKSLIENNKSVVFHKKYPLLYPLPIDFHQTCLENKLVIVHFKYATLTGDLNRIVITANHKKKDLIQLAAVLNKNQSNLD